MAEIFAAVDDQRVRTMDLVFPLYGNWLADITFTRPTTMADQPVVVTLAGLTLNGWIYRSGSYSGMASMRIVGGVNGWAQTIPEKYYNSPFGVKLKPVLSDAAQACGEKVSVAQDQTIGNFFVRRKRAGAYVLNQLVPGSWWMDNNGVTQVGTRTTPTIASQFDVIPEGTHLYIGRVVIATDKPEDWTPGCFFSAPTLDTKQVSTVVHKLDQNKLRTVVWTTP